MGLGDTLGLECGEGSGVKDNRRISGGVILPFAEMGNLGIGRGDC